jgi:hypothetical protein
MNYIYNKYYTYSFKIKNEISNFCIGSMIYRNKYILGDIMQLKGLFIPLKFWFCQISNLCLPICVLNGEFIDLRNINSV